MTALTARQAIQDIMLGSEPECVPGQAIDMTGLSDRVYFEIGRTYPTRGVVCKDGDVLHRSGTVIGQFNDHHGRLWLIVRYSHGRTGHVLPNGTSGLGYPHATDLVQP